MKSLTRASLYILVWDTPLTALAKEWGTSPDKLSALCDKFSIPRPPSGYWTRKQTGRVESPPPLDQRVYSADLLLEIPRINKRLKVDEEPRLSVHVPDKVARYDPAISRALKQYIPTTYRREPFLFAVTDPQTAALSVSKEAFKRAARILDVIYKHARKQGWPIESGMHGNVQVNVVDINGERVMFRIRERLTQSKRELSAEEQAAKAAGRWVDEGRVYLPTGRLLLSLEGWGYSGRTVWEDKPSRSLETWVGEFLFGLEGMAAHQRRRRELRESEEKRRAHEDKVMREVRQQMKIWSDRKEGLLGEFESWQRAEACRQFVSAVEQRMRAKGALDEAQEAWVSWANRLADGLDPVQRIADSDLSEWATDNPMFRALSEMTDFDDQARREFERSHELNWFETSLNSLPEK